MFEELMNLVRQSGQQSVVENAAVPNEHNEAVLQDAAASIQSGLQNVAQQEGGIGALKSMFQSVQNGDNSHPAVQQVADNVSGSLMQKFGLDSGIAKTIALSMVPMVLGKLMGSAQNAPAGSGLNIGNILGSLMGGGGIGGALGNLIPGMSGAAAQPQAANAGIGGGMLDSLATQFGLDKNHDGHTDLKDLLSMFGAA